MEEISNIYINLSEDVTNCDTDAFEKYEQNNWIYNKYVLAKLQNLDCNVMPITPSNFPVILRPIINLYGMSKDTYKVSDINNFYLHWGHQGFWCQYLTGTHRSIDCVILNNKIIWYCYFIGHKLDNVIGGFDYWELDWTPLNPSLLSNINKILNKLVNYTGIINFECIEDNIIECHLRPGDVLFLDNKVITQLNNLYENNLWNLTNYKEEKIFLLPIWKQLMKSPDLDVLEFINNYSNKSIKYEISPEGLSGPPRFKRKCLLYHNDINVLKDFRKNIYKI
jgi:hypothetical protein